MFVLVIALEGAAQAHKPGRIRSGPAAGEFLAHSRQDGTQADHLPARRHNVDLVAKLRLTSLQNGIADVGYFKGFAYLNAWVANCPDGGGVNVVDVRNPRNPRKAGFIPALPGEYPR